MSAIGTGMTLGEFVQRRRSVLRIEQAELIRRLPNRDRSWVSRIENDQFKHPIGPDAVAELAAALGCSQADVLEAMGFEVRESREATGGADVPTIYTVLEDIEILDLPAEARSAIRDTLHLAARLRSEIEARNHESNGDGHRQ